MSFLSSTLWLLPWCFCSNKSCFAWSAFWWANMPEQYFCVTLGIFFTCRVLRRSLAFNFCKVTRNKRPPHQYYCLCGSSDALTPVVMRIDTLHLWLWSKKYKVKKGHPCVFEGKPKKRWVRMNCQWSPKKPVFFSTLHLFLTAVEIEVAFPFSHHAVISLLLLLLFC